MALINYDFYSNYLGGDARINIILPDCPEAEMPSSYYKKRKKYRVVWLLHGGKGDCSDWLRKSRIELYANQYKFAVVLPSGYNTMYMDWLTYANGYRLNTFLFEELMPLIHNWFPISGERNGNFLAGLGGGGVAAFKYAMTHSDCFAAAAALSTSPRDYDKLFAEGYERFPKFVRVVRNYGSLDNFLSSEDNIKKKLQEAKQRGSLTEFLPMLAITGEQDHEIDQFEDFMQFSESLGLPIEYRIVPGKCHDWDFWDDAVKEAFAFFDSKR